MKKRPTHKITMKKKDSNRPPIRIGSAWQNDIGFNFLLDPGVCISWRDCEDCYFNIYEVQDEDSPPPMNMDLL